MKQGGWRGLKAKAILKQEENTWQKIRAKPSDKDQILTHFARTEAEFEYFLLTTQQVLTLGTDSAEQRNWEIHNSLNRLWINKGKKYGMVRIETIHLAVVTL